MSIGQSWLSYPQLVARLLLLSSEKSTGTLFCVTENDDSVTIAMEKGKIVALSFGLTQGLAALPLIRTVANCRARFKEKLVLRLDGSLPANCDVLRSLQLRLEAPYPRRVSVFLLDNRLLRNTIEAQASRIFGPIASVLCEEQFSYIDRLVTRDDLRRFLKALAAAAGKPEYAGNLIASVLQKTGIEERHRQRHQRINLFGIWGRTKEV